MRRMLTQGLNSPMTTSIGRLFDAVASLRKLCQHIRFEGQVAMALEFALEGITSDEAYHFALTPINGISGLTNSLNDSPSPALLDWAPVIEAVLRDVAGGVPAGMISEKFHNTLIDAVIAVARHRNSEKMALTGGCFQNKYLTEGVVSRLQAAGFRPYWHQRVPPNDGGIALGQLVAASQRKVWSNVSGSSR